MAQGVGGGEGISLPASFCLLSFFGKVDPKVREFCCLPCCVTPPTPAQVAAGSGWVEGALQLPQTWPSHLGETDNSLETSWQPKPSGGFSGWVEGNAGGRAKQFGKMPNLRSILTLFFY